MLKSDDTGSVDPFFTTRDRLDTSRGVLLKTFDKGSLTAAQYRSDRSDVGITTPNEVSDLHMAVVQLSDYDPLDMWCDDRHISRPALPTGSLSILDFRSTWVTELRQPFHTINFFVPRRALDDVTGLGALHAHVPQPYVHQHQDEVMLHLALALVPAFERPWEVNTLFADHIAAAVSVHLACTYGGARIATHRGGLSSWQERRAKEMLTSNLGDGVALGDLAKACGLSAGHFARGFKKTTGLPPHRWLLMQRIERAETLLMTTRKPLRDIAIACGFADHSHFTRVFSRMVGTTPGDWRRQKLS
jgi:AraC-like DNA-binding protein